MRRIGRQIFYHKQVRWFAISILVIWVVAIYRAASNDWYTTLLIAFGWTVYALIVVRWYVVDQNSITFRGVLSKKTFPWASIRQVRNDYPNVLLVEKKTFEQEGIFKKRILKGERVKDDFYYLTFSPKDFIGGKELLQLVNKHATNAVVDQSLDKLHLRDD